MTKETLADGEIKVSNDNSSSGSPPEPLKPNCVSCGPSSALEEEAVLALKEAAPSVKSISISEMLPLTGDLVETSHGKVTIVGVGKVGMECAYSILQQNIANELCLVDVMADKLKDEMMDLKDNFPKHYRTVKADTDYSITAGSKLCVITAGARQREGESHLSLVQRNVDIFKGIVPKLVQYSPDTTILVVSNPVDVLTYVTWKLSGLPQNRIIGSVISDREKQEIHEEVVDSAYEIIRLKAYTARAIGLSVAKIAQGIFSNSCNVYALSTNMKGFHGITDDVFLSVPIVLGVNGVTHIVNQALNPLEVEQLQKSANSLLEVLNGLTI